MQLHLHSPAVVLVAAPCSLAGASHASQKSVHLLPSLHMFQASSKASWEPPALLVKSMSAALLILQGMPGPLTASL